MSNQYNDPNNPKNDPNQPKPEFSPPPPPYQQTGQGFPQQPQGPGYPYQQPSQGYPQSGQGFPQQQPPKKNAWAWYKRQKKGAKIGIGCLSLVVLLVLCSIGSAISSAATGTTNIAQSTPTTQQVTQTTGTTKTATKPTPAPKPTPTPKPQPTFVTFTDGTFQVGKDIKPGTYRTRNASPGCYYARLKGFGSAVDDIIANNNAENVAIVTILASDKGFQSTNCGTWTADLSQVTKSKTSFDDGMYIVGTDIEPGTYKSSGQSGCYYARLKGFSNTTDDILANENTDTAAIVTLADGDKGFQSTRCGTWTKM